MLSETYFLKTGFARSGGFKFCYFPKGNLGSWIPFPAEAYSDEAVWQAVVPLPGDILGMIYTPEKSKDEAVDL